MSDVNERVDANTNTPLTALEIDQLKHNSDDTELLYRLYLQRRLNEQIRFYESRIRENENNASFTFGAGALVMTLSSLVATISASVATPLLTVLSAILPAFAAMFGAFRQLYGWERQASLYRDALLGLERVRLLTPDDDRIRATSLSDLYPQLVTSSETIFTSEMNQWGQFVLATEEEKAAAQETDPLNRMVDNLNLSDEQVSSIRKIMTAGRVPGTSLTTNVKTTTDVKLETPLLTEPAQDTTDASETPAASSDKIVTQFTATSEAVSTSHIEPGAGSAGTETLPSVETMPGLEAPIEGEPPPIETWPSPAAPIEGEPPAEESEQPGAEAMPVGENGSEIGETQPPEESAEAETKEPDQGVG